MNLEPELLPEVIPIVTAYPEAGVIRYYAVLAYPGRNEVKERQNFATAILSLRFKEYAQLLRTRDAIPVRYSSFKNERIDGAIRPAFKRLAKRLTAGQVGWNRLLAGEYECDSPMGKIELVIPGVKTIAEAMRK
jgi:hypothetical protein